MREEREIFDYRDPQADAESDARADADLLAGRVVDHGKVVEWLAKWGTAEETPAPPEWLA
jgi:predicted transcriptional regulator